MGLFSSRRSTTVNENFVTNLAQGFEDVDGTVQAGDGNVFAPTAIDYRNETSTDVNVSADYSQSFGGFEGPALFGDGINFTSISTDADAFRRANEYAIRTGETVRNIAAGALGVADSAIAAGVGFGRNAWEVSRSALDASRGITQLGLDYALEGQEASLGFARALFEDALSVAGDTIGETVTSVNAIARQQATSTDQRVERVALYAVGAVVATVVLLAIFRKG